MAPGNRLLRDGIAARSGSCCDEIMALRMLVEAPSRGGMSGAEVLRREQAAGGFDRRFDAIDETLSWLRILRGFAAVFHGEALARPGIFRHRPNRYGARLCVP
jgi:hypothetical protein